MYADTVIVTLTDRPVNSGSEELLISRIGSSEAARHLAPALVQLW